MNYENMAVTVSQVNSYIKEKIASDEGLNNLIIKGEISNFKNHYTGHMYFTLKDNNSLIKCIMFKSYTSNLKFVPKDGMSVLAFGTVSVFERDGVYQLYCKAMQEDGMGSLYAAYEELKAKLEKEGLVIGQWDDPKKKFQKFYSLTPLGEKEFDNRKSLLKHKIEESLMVFQIVYKDLYL